MRTALIATVAAVAAAVVVTPSAQAAEFTLIAEHSLPGHTRFAGKTVGGITGIDAGADGQFRLITKDRVFTARVSDCVTVTGVKELRQADGTKFPRSAPQGVRADNGLLWTDGAVVRESTANGAFTQQFPASLAGATLTGLATTPEGTVLTATEAPAAADGTATRLTLHDRATGELLVQFGYVADAPVAEILHVADSRFLVLEGKKLFEIDFATGATNIAGVDALAGQDYQPVAKTQVLDLTALGKKVDDVQGVSWGAPLADGARTLVFVTDNGLSLFKRTQFLVVRAAV
ncbi:esterase-like activity of phytase family protein [Lentzea sp. CA-135723]|uniref:esterase-like activity of phytase family protein n=1 Tax=Lentzea sp. CA-135723 TaxID=3239950 RepID=UPI003D8FE338